jgi:hypothetical protein
MAKTTLPQTIRELKGLGYYPETVEKWIPVIKHRKDFLGCFDVLGLKAREPILAVQTTSLNGYSSHVKKLADNPLLVLWLETGNEAELWSWSKEGTRWVYRRTVFWLEGSGVLFSDQLMRPKKRKAVKGYRQKILFPSPLCDLPGRVYASGQIAKWADSIVTP